MTEHPTELMGRQSAYQEGYEAGERAQVQRDAEADCYYCGNPAWEPALWTDDGGYEHKNKKGAASAWCDANLLWSAWAERAAQTEGQAKT